MKIENPKLLFDKKIPKNQFGIYYFKLLNKKEQLFTFAFYFLWYRFCLVLDLNKDWKGNDISKKRKENRDYFNNQKIK